MIGFIKLHRQLLDWEWYDDNNVFKVFIHILLKANFKPKEWRGITINRGELLTSLEHLAKETNLTVQQLRTVIKKLKSTGEITSKSTNKNTIIKLVNFDVYQCNGKENSTLPTSKVTSEITNEQQTNNKQVTTTKESKKEKKEIIEEEKPLLFKSEFIEICEAFTSITGNGIRIANTDSKIKRSDKYKKIISKLKDKYTVEEMIAVMEMKYKEWKDTPKMKSSIAIPTFFGSKFEKYIDQLEATAPISNESHPEAPTDTKERFKYFRNLFLKYVPHLEQRLVNTEYKDRIYQKKDAEGLIRDLERQNPQLLEL